MGGFRQTWVKILIVVILVLVVGSTAVYLLGTRQNQPNAITGTRYSSTIVQPSLTSLPTSVGQTNVIPGWTIYHSKQGLYSINVPKAWIVRQYKQFNVNPEDTTEEKETGMDIFPEDYFGIPPEQISITLHQNGDSELEVLMEHDKEYDKHPNYWFLKREIYYTNIAMHQAKVELLVWESEPPKDFVGEWYDKSEKYVYINLDEGRVLLLHARWENAKPEYEKLFDQVIYSLKLDA